MIKFQKATDRLSNKKNIEEGEGMRDNRALSFVGWKLRFRLLSRAQNSHRLQPAPGAVEVGESLSIGFSRPQAGFVNDRDCLHLAEHVKVLLDTLLAANVSHQVDVGSRLLQQIKKLEMSLGNEEREPESISEGSSPPSCLPHCSSRSGRSGELELPS